MWDFLQHACCMATIIIVLLGPQVLEQLIKREERDGDATDED